MNLERISWTDEEVRQWLDGFQARHGRPLRILHIGNIANNAYIISKFLHKVGVQSDVLCNDYYHIMGCPEWEDVEFEPLHIKDQNSPDWTRVPLDGYCRPRSFIQGPINACLRYLKHRNQGHRSEEKWGWLELSLLNRTQRLSFRHIFSRMIWRSTEPNHQDGIARAGMRRLALIWKEVMRGLAVIGRKVGVIREYLGPAHAKFASFIQEMRNKSSRLDEMYPVKERMKTLVEEFPRLFPDRKDRMDVSDLAGYLPTVTACHPVFEHYDIIIGYAIDGILPLLANSKPYFCFEHGTLRTFTMEPTAQCRRTAMCYRMADYVFVTNGDCIDYAERLKIPRYTTTLHPIDEHAIEELEDRREQVHEELGVRYVFLCSLRHDWKIKGTDHYIRALPGIREAIGADFKVLMTRWGGDLQASRDLAEQLGVLDHIVWTTPYSRIALHRMMKSVDIVFDQIALPHFGATAPEAIAAGTPVIMSYTPSSTSLIVDEPAPILSAWSAEDVVGCVQTALDPEWREGYRRRAANWIHNHHSHRRVVRDFIGACRIALEEAEKPSC